MNADRVRMAREGVDAAIQTAQQWMDLIDREKITASWKMSALTLRRSISQRCWEIYVESARAALGTPHSRNWLEVRREDGDATLAGPNVAVKFLSIYAAITVVEEVSLQIEADRWAPFGYSVHLATQATGSRQPFGASHLDTQRLMI
jgi:Protein of unknown function (DUF4019)